MTMNRSAAMGQETETLSSKMTLDTKLKKLKHRELVVFDFDDTVVDCNSDTWIHQLAPNKRIPERIEYRHGQDYFEHVQSVLAYLHEQRVSKSQYDQCLSAMPSVPGVLELIKELAKQPDRFDVIILSDSNSFFIGSYLRSKSLQDLISTVLTNPARFNEQGQLLVDEYHIQDYCSLSARNLCKGEVLKNFIGKRMLDHNTVYTCINYVGDGENDFCPSAKLSNRDRVFPREGYSLARLCARIKSSSSCSNSSSSSSSTASSDTSVNSNNNNNSDEDDEDANSAPGAIKLPELKATVIPWTTGEQILSAILGKNPTE